MKPVILILMAALCLSSQVYSQNKDFDLNTILFPSGSRKKSPRENYREKEIKFLKSELKVTENELATYTKLVENYMKASQSSRGKSDQAQIMNEEMNKITRELQKLLGDQRFSTYQRYREKIKAEAKSLSLDKKSDTKCADGKSC